MACGVNPRGPIQFLQVEQQVNLENTITSVGLTETVSNIVLDRCDQNDYVPLLISDNLFCTQQGRNSRDHTAGMALIDQKLAVLKFEGEKGDAINAYSRKTLTHRADTPSHPTDSKYISRK